MTDNDHSQENFDEVFCYCFNRTRRNVIDYLIEHPQVDIEKLIADTRIGTKCTACLLDLEVLISEKTYSDYRSLVSDAGAKAKVLPSRRMPLKLNDSGFFINDGPVSTSIHIANYNTLFGQEGSAVDYDLMILAFDAQGKRVALKKTHLRVGREFVFSTKQIANCPQNGWFLIIRMPLSAGHFGISRPQIILNGHSWRASYHTQSHSDASKSGWRSSVGIRKMAGKTRSILVMINGSNLTTRGNIEIPTSQAMIFDRQFSLHGNGLSTMAIDELFPDLPDNSSLSIKVTSDKPTRKFLLNVHEDGSMGMDHFPNNI